MNGEVLSAFVLLIIACVLLGCDAFLKYRTEGFADYDVGIPPGMCGVDIPSCAPPTRCINGYCKPETLPLFSATSGLPVKPEGYIRL
jgi:hypothetical protein